MVVRDSGLLFRGTTQYFLPHPVDLTVTIWPMLVSVTNVVIKSRVTRM